MRISDWSSDVCSSDLYVAETLMPLILDLEREYRAAKQDPEFEEEFQYLLRQYVGRPNPLYFAERLTKELGGAKVYLKREELNHTGAHKINNCIGQILLARRMGKRSEEHTSELQSLMRNSNAVFCLKKKKNTNH